MLVTRVRFVKRKLKRAGRVDMSHPLQIKLIGGPYDDYCHEFSPECWKDHGIPESIDMPSEHEVEGVFVRYIVKGFKGENRVAYYQGNVYTNDD